ncbi:hypothetical protein M0811_06432 [Anaeramoeba ignava]|uniref:Fibronectin type-III domain-containing protein n=1 Tax=Anaeramoeba ignava TaxID=1746090 RepID=A0A9Q0LP62_ANAIG|nr:hypothetical protein M0811_06432 [Anaeramoeba ignava]
MKKIQNFNFLIQFFLLIFSINFISSFENQIEWVQEQILIANDGKEYEYFGSSIDFEGNICVIGSFCGDVGNNSAQGKAYIYEKNGKNWNQKQILVSSDGQAYDGFGLTVSISGNFLLISSPYATVGENESQGKAYIFENDGAFWNQKQILLGSDGQAEDNFGSYLFIEGNLILIGSPYANIGENVSQGKAYVYENNGTFWNEKQILIASDGQAYDNFGSGVSISNDGKYIFVGASDATVGESNYDQGKVYIFENNGTFWNEKQILIASDGKIDDNFGYSISISGNYSLIGSPMATVNDHDSQGKAYIFENNGTYWNEKQILIASDGNTNDQFSSSISISGNASLIGSYNSNVGESSAEGKAYVFQNNGTYWKQSQILFASDGNTMYNFGWSVSLSANYSLIGAPNALVGDNKFQGEAYIFEPFPKPPAVNILNCSSLFSSFECYWNQINSSLNDIEYQINYQTDVQNWQLIQSPILIQNVFYQVFNSSFYPNITGNVDYSIQIRVCNSSTNACSDPSNQINLTTRIDSVNNLKFQSYPNSIQLNWNYPNVPIINSIPKLNHYFLSYQILNSNQSTNISISNSSTSFQINNLQSLTNYLISICGCRTEQCLGEDQGEISTIQIQTNQKTTSSSKSKKTTIVLAIIIPIIVIIGIILTIILIKKKKKRKTTILFKR